MIRILNGDCRAMMRALPDDSVHCCITSPHKAFARQVIALARKTGMNNISLRFQHDSLSPRTIDGEPVPAGKAWQEVTVVWNQGRHGAEAEIALAAQAVLRIKEQPAEGES